MKRDTYSEMLQATGQEYLARILGPDEHRRYAQKVAGNIANDSATDRWEWCDCCQEIKPVVHACEDN